MLISIIIPCYNAEKYIKECLSSVKCQNYTDWEAICVDDGSSDNTKTILENYSKEDKRFVVISQKNHGVSVARNNAIARCKGEYVCFVDSDDTVEPDFLEHLAGFMKGDTDLVISDFTREMKPVERKEEVQALWKKKGDECAGQIIVDKTFNPQLWCMMFKRSIIEEYNINFYPGCTRGEDWEFFMKYIAHTDKVVYTGYITYHYRNNEVSVMKQLNEKSFTSIDASKRVTEYYAACNNKASGVVKQYSVSRTIWKFVILTVMEHNKDLYRKIVNDYDVKSEMRKMYSYPGIIEKLSSRMYNFMRPVFIGCFYVYGLINKNR